MGRWHWMVPAAVLVILVAGASLLLRVQEEAPPTYSRDQVVLQVTHTIGFGPPGLAGHEVPDVTLWGDGKVVFVDHDQRVREGRIDPEQVARLIASATFLYNGPNEYPPAEPIPDAGTTYFELSTDRGRKTVGATGLSGEASWRPRGRLWQLLTALRAALPADSDPFQPTVVKVVTAKVGGEATTPWPAELQGQLTGAQMSAALALSEMGRAKTFLVDGKPHLVLVVPVLPEPGEP